MGQLPPRGIEQESIKKGEVTFRVAGLTKIYGEGPLAVHALRGIDLDLYESEIVVLVGPSGSGKSTFLNILGGLDHPTDGHVFFRAEELTGFDDSGLTAFRRAHVGFVFQFYNLIASLTAAENVSLVTEIADRPLTAVQALDLVGLADRAGHFPAELSGGEQQRVAVARAIAKQPDILLCDEPTGALDSETGILVLEAIERVNRELGTTTVLITHNAAISAMADRVVTFADGRIAEIAQNTGRAPVRDLSW
jgi:putative ABC transport system ATP-binding protein